MKVRLCVLERTDPASSYRIYTEKLLHALRSAGIDGAEISTIPAAAEARRGGVLRPTWTHFTGRFAEGETVHHATEPNAALRGVDVVTLHDLYPFQGSGAAVHAFRAVIRSAARRAPRIVTLSGAIRSDVARFLGPVALRKTRVIPPPFPTPELGRPAPEHDVAWVGSAEPRKQPERFLRTLAELSGTRLRVVFLCHTAPGARNDALQAALRAARGRHDVEWIGGSVGPEALDRLYRASRALVSTSRIEGYHYPVMEAWSRGTPVVLPDIPLYREIYGSVGGVYYFDPSGSFDRALREALDAGPHGPDPRLLDAVSFPAVGRRLAELYRELS